MCLTKSVAFFIFGSVLKYVTIATDARIFAGAMLKQKGN